MLILHYKISLPKNPNQHRQFTALTMLDNGYVFVQQDHTTLMTSQKLDYKMFTMR